MVLPVDRETLKQIKHLKIGEAVTFDSDGAILAKGLRL